MANYIVHMPSTDVRRLDMFSSNVLVVQPMPGLVSLSPRQAVVVVRMSETVADKLKAMFPAWRIELQQDA